MRQVEREPITLRVPRRRRIFQDLMRHRVRHILMVSSLYDSFILTEDGQLNEALMRQFVDLNLNQNPDLIRVSSGAEAVALARDEGCFDMIITSVQVGDMNAVELARAVQEAGLDLPVVLLAYNNRELNEFLHRQGRGGIDRVFLWQGNVRILLAMVKDQEDKRNVERDTGRLGVPALLVVEDNIRFYSSFLPVIYSELMDHSQRLLSEGLNLSQKILRMRARPKLLLCETFEEAWAYFEKYEENILGVLSDFEFPRNGSLDRGAGCELVSRIHAVRSDIPTVMQSSIPENETVARGLNAAFLLKGSPLLLHNLRDLLLNRFGFGDFVFRLPDGSEIDRAADLKSLVDKLKTVPLESLAFHGERNHFSMWLKARTEYELAEVLRARSVSEFGSLQELRDNLVDALSDYRLARDRSVVADFDRSTYEQSISMARIGGGSLGGKARGLAFANRLLLEAHLDAQFPGIRIGVPSAVVLGTDIFDEFLEKKRLDDFALSATSDDEIREKFATAHFPRTALRDLRAFLQEVEYPLAVRSSGLLEDSPSQPLAGVYRTVMVPNIGSLRDRLADLIAAIKSVYASTFSQQAKAFLKMTPFRLEEEKMAVIIQQIVGRRIGDRFYPDFSGVARSQNVYPSPPMKVEDGIAAVALGLGRAVVEGCMCVQFSPRHPRNVLAFSTVESFLKDSQREFFALDLSRKGVRAGPEGAELTKLGLVEAEADGTLAAVGSTYSTQNHTVSDGIGRPGLRLVSFAPILKHGLFPLAELLDRLLDLGRKGTGSEVEIEFAVNLKGADGGPPEFGFLQMRPSAMAGEQENLEIGDIPPSALLCRSRSVLGHGKVTNLRDLVVVDAERFDRMRSRDIADQLARVNGMLQNEGAPYLLVGVGRWGSLDRHLGIPVTWNQIAGARVIVESGFRDMHVTPSQGTHFFQNLTSLNVGYFTVNPQAGDGFIDWEWLANRPAREDTGFVRHLRLERPIQVLMNGRTGEGVILKPDEPAAQDPSS
ncbi:MAG TPA: PEP/pyruvate-binding domain-containing protein [Candidatus Polarisedimenticolia bacterium]|nr:PEP/pyruvate-binding domain-containing protein [Candidatus Polarisedimenticolia bacterium]